MLHQVKDQYACTGEDGRDVTVYELQETVKQSPLSGPVKNIDGAKTLETEDGKAVNALPDGTFKIVASGEILTKR